MINDCIHFDGRDCGIGAYLRPSPGVCHGICQKRVPRDGSTPAPAPIKPRIVLAPINPIPRDQWPETIRIMATLAIDGEKGIGDVYDRLAKGGNAEFWREKVSEVSKSCGCQGNRRGWLNAHYPL